MATVQRYNGTTVAGLSTSIDFQIIIVIFIRNKIYGVQILLKIN